MSRRFTLVWEIAPEVFMSVVSLTFPFLRVKISAENRKYSKANCLPESHLEFLMFLVFSDE